MEMRRSQKSSLLECERHPSGCTCVCEAHNMFDSGGLNKKLLKDLKPFNRQCVGYEDVGFTNSMPYDLEKTNRSISDRMPITDSIKENRKILIEGKMLSKQRTNGATKLDTKHENQEALNNSHLASSYALCHGCKHAAYMRQQELFPSKFVDKSLDKLNSTASVKKECNQLRPVSVIEHKEKSTRSNKYEKSADVCLQGQLNEVAEVFVNQKLIDGRIVSKDGSQPKHFLDALEILNSNKELFTKLLQDPKTLLVRRIQDLKGAQAEKHHIKSSSKDKLSVHHTSRASQFEGSIYNQKVRSDRYRAKETDDSHLSDIVILKPDLSRTRSPDNMIRDATFSFRSIKRKLSKAMKLRRKKAQRMSTESAVCTSPSNHQGPDSCRGSVQETIGQITPYELIAAVGMAKSCLDGNRKYDSAWSKDYKLFAGHESAEKNCNASSHHTQADKIPGSIGRDHFARMLDNAYKGEDMYGKRDLRTTMSTSSLAEYDLLPRFRSARDQKHQSVTMQTRFPYCRNHQMANETSCSRQIERRRYLNHIQHDVELMNKSDEYRPNFPSKALHALPKQLENMFSNAEVNRDNHSGKLNASSKESSGNLKEEEKIDFERKSDAHFHPEKTHRVDTTRSCKNNSMTNTCKNDLISKTLELDVIVENKTSASSSVVYSPSPLTINRIHTDQVKALNLGKDGAEQPSPISVLEQTFKENEINHRTTFPPAEVHELPSKETNEECANASLVGYCHDRKNSIVSAEEHDSTSTSKLVEAVLDSSRLDWDEILRCQASDKLLDPSLFKETCPGKLSTEQRLLFDLINEVLVQTYHRRIRGYPWLAFLAPSVCTFSMEKDLAPEVTKCIDGHLQQQPQTLEELVMKDLDNATKWIDIRVDAEDIGTEIAGSIIEKLIMETISY